MSNKNESAFPLVEAGSESESVSLGLSKREYMAAMAMQGILANHWCQNDYKNDIHVIGQEQVAKQAIMYADALLKELEN